MTTTLTRIRVLATAATIGLFGTASAPAFSEDGFTAIHMDNQKANSAVSTYWEGVLAAASAPAFWHDGFMAIHMDNQKATSAVSTYWKGLFGTGSAAAFSHKGFMANHVNSQKAVLALLQPGFDATAAREFPQAIFDRIAAKITAQTTFQQLSPEGVLRWWPMTIKVVEFVKAPSPTYRDTYLFAMRYVVSVISEKDSFAAYGTSCQVTVVYKDKAWDEPTVACAPVNLDQPNHPS